MDHRRDLLLRLAGAGIEGARGDAVVAGALRGVSGAHAVVALGKAAGAMAAGAAGVLVDAVVAGFVAHPRGYRWNMTPGGATWTVHEGGHPLPDEGSLAAGRALRGWLAALPGGVPLLVLMSGGSSACIEDPVDGVSLARLREANAGWLASGLDIHEINRRRGELSRLKCGRALELCGDREVTVLVISDVPGDDPAVVGSGPFLRAANPGDARVIATNRMALHAIVNRAADLGIPVNEVGTLDGDALALGARIGAQLADAETGLHLWGGECTVTLPDAPGRGGRCQALALAAARQFENHSRIALLALATDGIDGNGPDAGALVDGGTVARLTLEDLDPADALARADAGNALAAAGDLVQTGPTGTNVMDLVLAYVSA